MDRDALLDRLSEDVLAYVMHGSFPERHIARELSPDELDERFHDYDSLVRLHFVLRPEVVDFVERLPERLRSLQTRTESTTHTTRGTVDGQINWSETFRIRRRKNPRDSGLFVCENRSEDYDTDENIVLKRLLSIIHQTVTDCERYLSRDYEWVNDRWRNGTDLIRTVRETFRRNVHISRIRSPAAYEPTERMLQRAGEAREPVYRDATRLLREYRRVIDGEPEAVSNLLEQTAITPQDDETLFELFVLFRFVEAIEQFSEDRFELRTIESGRQEVARLSDDEREITLYHDSAARAEGLRFVSDVEAKDPSGLSRTERIQYEADELADEYFVNEKFRTRTGRPDVIVLEIDSGDELEYLITEVKYSDRSETIVKGIEETLEYLAFIRRDGELLHDPSAMFGDGWNGMLVVDDLEQETRDIETQRLMRILQASELDDRLEEVIEQALD